MTIAEIREALSVLPPGQVPTPEDWDRLATQLRGVVTRRIDELFGLLDELDPTARDSPADPMTSH